VSLPQPRVTPGNLVHRLAPTLQKAEAGRRWAIRKRQYSKTSSRTHDPASGVVPLDHQNRPPPPRLDRAPVAQKASGENSDCFCETDELDPIRLSTSSTAFARVGFRDQRSKAQCECSRSLTACGASLRARWPSASYDRGSAPPSPRPADPVRPKPPYTQVRSSIRSSDRRRHQNWHFSHPGPVPVGRELHLGKRCRQATRQSGQQRKNSKPMVAVHRSRAEAMCSGGPSMRVKNVRQSERHACARTSTGETLVRRALPWRPTQRPYAAQP